MILIFVDYQLNIVDSSICINFTKFSNSYHLPIMTTRWLFLNPINFISFLCFTTLAIVMLPLSSLIIVICPLPFALLLNLIRALESSFIIGSNRFFTFFVLFFTSLSLLLLQFLPSATFKFILLVFLKLILGLIVLLFFSNTFI